MICCDIGATLPAFLTRTLPQRRMDAVRRHLDACPPCWCTWNKLRWDAAKGTPLYTDLFEYLGDRFQPYFDSSRHLAVEWDRAAPTTTDEIRAFYSTTESYLYNQVIWHASGNRPPYVHAALPVLRRHQDAAIVDFGCGIGVDTIELRAPGFTVVPCGFDAPPTRFRWWRQQRLGQQHEVHDPSQLPFNPGATVAWIIDTIDHVVELDLDLQNLLGRATLVITENHWNDRAHGLRCFHIRRSPAQLEASLLRFGFAPTQQPGASDHLTIWHQLPPSGRPRRCRPDGDG
jgi:hypothetical protein